MTALMKKYQKPPFDTRLLANIALRAASKARVDLGYDQIEPLCIYDACDKHGVSVRFVDINMDGMYNRAAKPKILISNLRPLVRRNMTCAHELGHHVFEHGSTIHEIESTSEIKSSHDPKEFLADRFASHLLMPTLGMRKALNIRTQNSPALTPQDIWAISSDFKVGYTTVLYHLFFGLSVISKNQFESLKKSTPQLLRNIALGFTSTDPAIFVDQNSCAKTLDLETGDWIVSRDNLIFSDSLFSDELKVPGGFAYQALNQGIARVEGGTLGQAFFARISRKSRRNGYVGLAKYRHLSEVNDG
ncbi:ImmA/IrrE family metallo-endopeptidase [Kordiimonas aquimaris]|uniref:ImmA/IrrE family metallo-endopeptidase n=1 Tax=Kordiimonas aquimaris TaxID=707591 RepID=UPI0021CE8D0C|nr:ImmA/IrrE family metallo-endopeptidase [Kordiimonas aquimaris]